MAVIDLSRGKQAIIDDEVLEDIAPYRWRAVECRPGKFYAARYETGVSHTQRRLVYMHRLIADAPHGSRIDHVNNNSLDNRLCNLRVATVAQNRANSGKNSHRRGKQTSSQFKGVYWSRAGKKWVATIGRKDKWEYLGRFDDEREAARAYDEAAKRRYGEFALLNEV